MSDIGYGRSLVDDLRINVFTANCARLALSAERWGAKGQSHRLGMILNCLAAGHVSEAATIRDLIKQDRDEAMFMRCIYGAMFALIITSIGFAIHAALR